MLILLNFYMIYRLVVYLRFVKLSKGKVTLDGYLVASFITLIISLIIRSIINIVMYILEIKYEKEVLHSEDFNMWLKDHYYSTYVAVVIVYLVVLSIRNASLLINLTRWTIIKYGLEDLCMRQLDFYEKTYNTAFENEGFSELPYDSIIDELINRSKGKRIRAPTVQQVARNLLDVKGLPSTLKKILIGMLVLDASLFIFLAVYDLEKAIFLICAFHYYLISAFLVYGYVKTFLEVFSLLLIQ
jgi:hypothetical protein